MKRFFKYLILLFCAVLLFILAGALFLWHTEESDTHALIDALQTPVAGHETARKPHWLWTNYFSMRKLIPSRVYF